MGKTYDAIDDTVAAFIRQQHVFFVATAPSASDGHINLSPKGLETFAILDPTTVAYLDLTGSGVETIAHLRDNGCIVIMFCAFEGSPKIVRLHGHGEVIENTDPRSCGLRARFPSITGARSVIRVALDRISDSCGYAVPLYRYEAERPHLVAWAERKGAEGLVTYRAAHNRHSVDGLAGLTLPPSEE